jgi:hypothetical protein
MPVTQQINLAERLPQYRKPKAALPAPDPAPKIAQALEIARDFGRFCDECVYIQDKRTRRAARFKPYDCQRTLTDALTRGDWIVCLKPRQIGATTLLAVFVAWKLVTEPMFQVLVLQQNRDYAKNFLQRVRFIHRHLPTWLRVKIFNDSRYELSFNHGKSKESELRVLSGKDAAGRSFTADLVIVDEHAYVPNAAEARQGCEPTLEMTGGQMVCLSSSAGPHGDFYTVWKGAPENGYTPIFFPYDAHPDRDQTWYNETKERKKADPLFMPREYPRTPEEAFKHAEGRCFPMFDPLRHSRTFADIRLTKESGELFRGIDFGAVNAFACVWIAHYPGEPAGFTVDPSCMNLIREFTAYRFERKSRTALGGVPERPVKRDDHTVDAVRYACMTYGFSGHVHVFRELYVEDSVGKGRTDLHDLVDIHQMSGWVEGEGEDECRWKPGPDGEDFQGTICDRNQMKTIELFCMHDLPCDYWRKPRGVPMHGQILDGIARLNLLIDGTRDYSKRYDPDLDLVEFSDRSSLQRAAVDELRKPLARELYGESPSKIYSLIFT